MRSTIFWLACLALPAAALAADSTNYSRRIAAAPQDRIEISNVAGSVKITAWDRPEVEVQGRLSAGVERVAVERQHGVVEVRVIVRSWRTGRDSDADLQVYVPAASALEVSAVSASLTVAGGRGRMRLKSISGGVRADVQSSDLEIQTVSGRISLRSSGSNSQLRATSVSGGIELANVNGEMEARTTSGSLNVNADAASSVRLHTVSGGITFRGRLLRDASLEAESVSGHVTVTPAADAGYRYEVTTYSGSIDSCLGTDAERVNGGRGMKRLDGARGAASARISIKSLSGGVSLCDSAAPAPSADDSQGSTSTVNESIRVGDGASIGKAQTVNGSIRVGAAGRATDLKTVNGAVVVGDGARIQDSVGTVNGSISLGKQVEVMGDVVSVNGSIRLVSARVHGQIATTNSSIDVGAGSRVDGGIHVHGCWQSGLWTNSRCEGTRVTPLRIVIRAGATVQGRLKFERDVELYVSDRATIGAVEGTRPIAFSGSEPPTRK